MSGILEFDMKEIAVIVNALEAHQKAGGEFRATMDMLFDGENYPKGEPMDEDGNIESESKAEFFWPSDKHMLPDSKVPVLQLVGDNGCYCIGNLISDQSPSESGLIAYAKGCNPEKDEMFYENKRSIFGGDDGSVTIPLAWVEIAKRKDPKKLKISLSPKQVKLVH